MYILMEEPKASMVGINLMIGGIIVSPIMGRLGRKVAHHSVSVSGIVGWLITLMASNFEILLIGRVLLGLSYGMMLPLRSMLIGEYTSPKNRGGFLTTVSLSQGLGIFFVHFIGSFLTWQKSALVCMFLPMISLIMTLYSPESPSYLADKGRYDECRKHFRWLRGNEEEAELDDMITARKFLAQNRRNFNLMETLTDKAFYKPIILMFFIYIMAQFSGATNMASYSTVVIKLIIGPESNVNAWMIGLDILRSILNFLAIFIINKMKRRTMMFASGGLCIASHVAIIVYVYMRDGGIIESQTWIPGTFMILQFVAMSVGMMPIPGVVSGEIFPLQYRSAAGSISLFATAGTLFISLKTFPGLISGVGIGGAYIFYASVLSISLTIAWFTMPETKDRTLQQIEDKFTGRVSDDVKENQSLNKDEEKV